MTRRDRHELIEESPATIDPKTERISDLTSDLIEWLEEATKVVRIEITRKAKPDSE